MVLTNRPPLRRLADMTLVCKEDAACDALMPEGKGGVCYKQGAAVRENYQICDVTNRKILDLLKEEKPQVTFSCNAERADCNFQCGFLLPHSHTLWLTLGSLGGPEGIVLLCPRRMQVEDGKRLRPE